MSELDLTAMVIQVKELHFAYPDCPQVLCDVNLCIRAGERLGIIGPNGSGKTTFFHLLCGVLRPVTGQINVLGQPLMVGEFRPEVGLVFQNPDDQLFSASVWEDVAFGPQNLGLSPAEVAQRVTAALTLTQTQHLSDRPPHHLSGGQKQMVAIAGVLAMQPQIMLYDEPSASLDLKSRRRLIQFLQQSQQTLLISSHDLDMILEVCDRVVLLDQGRIMADGPALKVMGDATLMVAHGLEPPPSLYRFS